MGCTLARPCDGHWFAARVTVVGTSNNDSELQGKAMFDTPQHQSSCHLVRCFRLFVHRRCRLVVTRNNTFLKTCSWTSTHHHGKKRSHAETRETPTSRAQRSDFIDHASCSQRAQTTSVPLPRTPEPIVLAPETPFQQVFSVSFNLRWNVGVSVNRIRVQHG